MVKQVSFYVVTVLMLCISCAKDTKQEQKQPNLIVIYTDDQRTQTLSCYDGLTIFDWTVRREILG